MIRLKLSLQLAYEIRSPGADFVFNVHAARTDHQHVLHELLHIDQAVPWQVHEDRGTQSRYVRLQANPGWLNLRYDATVDVAHHVASPHSIAEVRVSELPDHVLPYLYPSRYCESDQLHAFAMEKFGGMWQGYERVAAICEWLHGLVAFRSNSSDGKTSALGTLQSREGVCRDFAHLMIALCRAINIPARFVTGIDYGADPALGPQDFHAYVEAYLGRRWYIFDPSGTAIPMGLVRMATGYDAGHAAFATIFGDVESGAPVIVIDAVANDAGFLAVPWRTTDALSTHAG